jgi:pimeloyl-ACP methyl ester carboxylesterase
LINSQASGGSRNGHVRVDMHMKTNNESQHSNVVKDARGAGRLATDVVTGLTELVEAMHANIARLPGTAVAADGRTRGITGLVYGAVRGTARAIGGGLDLLLRPLEPLLEPRASTPGREAVLAALNGVLGDKLDSRANPLAITMSLRRGGVPLEISRAGLAAALPDATGRVLVLLHGLCMNDRQWARDGADFGAALARDLGATPLYLHYNSGRHISSNGRDFASLMEALVREWPVPLQGVDLLAHSMGGLVARSALHHAAAAGQRWPSRVRKLVFLGTPHHGAPLERGGHRVDMLLSLSAYSAPLARLGQVRSAGITDLRHGSLLDSDWSGQDRFAHGKDTRTPVPLPAGIECFAIAATKGESDSDLAASLVGDGLVPLASALGKHRKPAFALRFDEARQWVAQGTNHLQLQTSPAVYERLRGWLSADFTTA